jgi:hypothetical protein
LNGPSAKFRRKMKHLDSEWVKTQLQAAKVRKPVGDSTIKLIELFDSFDLSDEHRVQTVDMFTKLAMGHAFVKENKNEVWVPARPGDIKVSDEIRVRADAFDGSLGMLHNGRRGVVVGVRYGDVIVKTTDGKEPVLDGAHYSPHMLEKMVKTA